MDNIKIMLVDDEKDVLTVMGERIKSWGCDLTAVSSGKGAIDRLATVHPDIIILDYLMPEMDGVRTLEEIRRIDKKVPVIMFTAHPDGKSIQGTEKLGVSAYIPKLSSYSDASSSLRIAIEIIKKSKIC